jgi:hypothetical protein
MAIVAVHRSNIPILIDRGAPQVFFRQPELRSIALSAPEFSK